MITRKARSTGTQVTLSRKTEDIDADHDWLTTCEAHACFVSHPSKRVALSWLSHPEEWCGGCQDACEGKVER